MQAISLEQQVLPAVPGTELEFRRLLEILPAAAYTCDEEGLITYFNRRAVETWGREPKLNDPVDRYCGSFRLFSTNGALVRHDQCWMARCLLEGKEYIGEEIVIERPDGTRLTVQAHATPFHDELGRLTGAVNVLLDITDRKLTEAALRESEAQLEAELADTKLLQEISAQLVDEQNTQALYEKIMDGAVAIMRSDYASMQVLYPERGDGGELRLLAFRGFNPQAAKFWEWVGADSESTCGAALRTGTRVIAPDVEKCDFMAGTADLEAYLQTGIHAVQTTPLISRGGRMLGMISTHWREPHQPSLRDLRLLDILARQAADLIDRARAAEHAAELLAREQQARSEAETLKEVSQALAGELSLEALIQRVTDAATQLTKAKFGAFFYNVTNEHGESYFLYALSGAPREAFEKFGLPRNTPLFGATFSGESVVRIDDVRTDPRYGKNPPHHGMPKGHLPVRSYLAAPVVSRSGHVIGGLFFGHPEPAVFTESAERIAVGIAAQAAIAIDNARLYEDARNEISRRKAIEQTLRRSEDALREADRRKDEFLAVLSHELRNPLAPISSAVHLLRLKASDEPEIRWSREVIERQVNHLTRLIDDLLDVSRITRNKLEIRKQRLELAEVVHAAVETSRPAIEERSHELTVRLPPDPVYLSGDLIRLAQVFMNLLTNAAKYTEPRGRIDLTAELVGGGDCPGEVVVRVKDNGVGVPAEKLPCLFGMFFQVDHSLGRSQGGLGIGLALVRRLVELHGGTVTAHSEGPGKGSEFAVCLPVLAAQEPQLALKKPGDDAEKKIATRHRIVVADDNRDAAESLAMLLRLMGNEVHVAHDGLTALGKLEEVQPDLALLDIGMPNLDGYDVCSRVRQSPWGKKMILIAITGWGQDEDRRRTSEAGFDGHIVKPADYSTLERLLVSLSQTRSEQTANR